MTSLAKTMLPLLTASCARKGGPTVAVSLPPAEPAFAMVTGDGAEGFVCVDCRNADAEICGCGGSIRNLCALCCGKFKNVVIFGTAGFGEGTDYAGKICSKAKRCVLQPHWNDW